MNGSWFKMRANPNMNFLLFLKSMADDQQLLQSSLASFWPGQRILHLAKCLLTQNCLKQNTRLWGQKNGLGGVNISYTFLSKMCWHKYNREINEKYDLFKIKYRVEGQRRSLKKGLVHQQNNMSAREIHILCCAPTTLSPVYLRITFKNESEIQKSPDI